MTLLCFMNCCTHRKGSLMEATDSVHPRRKHNDYSSSLTPNSAYGGKNFVLSVSTYVQIHDCD